MTCPHLEYREATADRQFDVSRAYCTVADRFVQPMRADICNDRHDLDHAEHCEIFLDAEGENAASGRATTGDGTTAAPTGEGTESDGS